MRRLMASAIVCVINCVMILAQQAAQQSLKPTAAIPSVSHASDALLDAASLQLLPHFTFGRPQTNNLRIPPSGQATEPESPFVVMNGAVFMRLTGEQFLVPMSGGGASGCFSLDLPQRIKQLKEFVPKLEALKNVNP